MRQEHPFKTKAKQNKTKQSAHIHTIWYTQKPLTSSTVFKSHSGCPGTVIKLPPRGASALSPPGGPHGRIPIRMARLASVNLDRMAYALSLLARSSSLSYPRRKLQPRQRRHRPSAAGGSAWNRRQGQGRAGLVGRYPPKRNTITRNSTIYRFYKSALLESLVYRPQLL